MSILRCLASSLPGEPAGAIDQQLAANGGMPDPKAAAVQSETQLRVCVQFAGDYPPLYYAAEPAVAAAISDAFAGSADPVVTVDHAVDPALRPFPCQSLFRK